jgi:hypothetical protein
VQFNFVNPKKPVDPVKQMLRDNSHLGKWDGTPEWLDPSGGRKPIPEIDFKYITLNTLIGKQKVGSKK